MNYIWIYQYLNFTKDGLNFMLNTEEIGLTASTNSSIIKATTQKKTVKKHQNPAKITPRSHFNKILSTYVNVKDWVI